MHQDPRVREIEETLDELRATGQPTTNLTPAAIIEQENQGRLVDLITGKVKELPEYDRQALQARYRYVKEAGWHVERNPYANGTIHPRTWQWRIIHAPRGVCYHGTTPADVIETAWARHYARRPRMKQDRPAIFESTDDQFSAEAYTLEGTPEAIADHVEEMRKIGLAYPGLKTKTMWSNDGRTYRVLVYDCSTPDSFADHVTDYDQIIELDGLVAFIERTPLTIEAGLVRAEGAEA